MEEKLELNRVRKIESTTNKKGAEEYKEKMKKALEVCDEAMIIAIKHTDKGEELMCMGAIGKKSALPVAHCLTESAGMLIRKVLGKE